LSDGGSIWFDAADEPDGAEEFILDPPHSEAGAPEDRIPVSDGQSTPNASEESDTDDEEEVARLSLAVSDRVVKAGAQQLTHRTSLPSGPVADEGSLFAVFKKNVGKVHSTDVLCVELFLIISTERTLLVLHSP
jgi:hypothetical protein